MSTPSSNTTPAPVTVINEPAPSKVPQWLQMLPLPKAHWTPRYIMSRMAWSSYQRRNPDAPWLTQAMIEFLKGYLRPTDTLVEFGSGRSTMWLARHVGRMISIEHHKAWHAKITGEMTAQGVKNIEYLNTSEAAADYVGAADKALGDAKADMILVDGIHREKCAIWALEHVKPGGMIVIDNVNWFIPHATFSPPKFGTHPHSRLPEWQQFIEATKTWRRNWTSNNVSDTAAFFAPLK